MQYQALGARHAGRYGCSLRLPKLLLLLVAACCWSAGLTLYPPTQLSGVLDPLFEVQTRL